MLVLTRKAGEEIIIDGRIRIRLLQTGQGRIRLGIDAPADISVIRGELVDFSEPSRDDDVSVRSSSEGKRPLGAAM